MARTSGAYILFLVFVYTFQHDQSTFEQYLYKTGYLKTAKPNKEMLEKAVKLYQKASGLPISGVLDQNTAKHMMTPRCGKPYNLPEVKQEVWKTNVLTYKLRNWIEPFNETQIQSVIEKSIESWTTGVNLNITESKSMLNADINIYFTDQDGRSNMLGYAYFPENGSIYIDKAEDWSLDRNGIDGFAKFYFDWVIAHEIGHSLGLEHVDTTESIMNAFYTIDSATPSIADKNSLVEIYGGNPSLDNSELCKNSLIDGILKRSDREFLVFKGRQYWKLVDGALQSGPYFVDIRFPGLPENIDAAFSIKSLKYFLKNDRFYKYKSLRKLDSDKSISGGFDPAVPTKIDAAFYEPSTKIVYLFKGSKYYLMDIVKITNRVIDPNGKNISETWGEIPNNIEAATVMEDKILFIKSNLCYLVDINSTKLVQKASCSSIFFGCPQEKN